MNDYIIMSSNSGKVTKQWYDEVYTQIYILFPHFSQGHLPACDLYLYIYFSQTLLNPQH